MSQVIKIRVKLLSLNNRNVFLILSYRYTQTGVTAATAHYQTQSQYTTHQPPQQYLVDQTGSIVGGMNVSESSSIVCNPAATGYNTTHLIRYGHQTTPNRR